MSFDSMSPSFLLFWSGLESWAIFSVSVALTALVLLIFRKGVYGGVGGLILLVFSSLAVAAIYEMDDHSLTPLQLPHIFKSQNPCVQTKIEATLQESRKTVTLMNIKGFQNQCGNYTKENPSPEKIDQLLKSISGS